MTVDPDAAGLVAAEAVVVERPFDIIDHEKIEPAIVVVVEPPRGHRPHAAPDAGASRQVFECPVAAISVEQVAAHARNEEIDEPVVVEIRCRRTHRVATACDACLRCDVRELHAAVVSVEPVPVLRVFLFERRNGGPVREEEIDAAIVVVVESGDAARDCFDQVLPRSGVVLVNELDAGGAGDFAEAYPARRARGE